MYVYRNFHNLIYIKKITLPKGNLYIFSANMLLCVKTKYNIKYTIYNIKYTIYNIQYTIYNIQYTIYNIHFFTNLEFWRENSIFHLFPNVDRFSKNILIFKDWTLKTNIFERTRIWGGSDEKWWECGSDYGFLWLASSPPCAVFEKISKPRIY